MFRATLQQDLAFFGGAAQTSELIRQITEDTKEACASVKHLFQNGLRAVAGLLGGAHALYTLSPSLSLVTLTLLPLGGVAFDRFGLFVRGYSRASQRALVEALGRLHPTNPLRTGFSHHEEGSNASSSAR